MPTTHSYCPTCRSLQPIAVDQSRPLFLKAEDGALPLGKGVRRRWLACLVCGTEMRTLEIIEEVGKPADEPLPDDVFYM